MYENEYHLEKFSVHNVKEPYEYFFELRESLEEPIGECIVMNQGYRVYQDGHARIRYVGTVGDSLDGAYIRTYSIGKRNEVQLLESKFPNRIGIKTVLKSMDVQHLLTQIQGLILHCSYVAYNDKAILFTAPSETGKSTQAELWKNLRNAQIINGDRAAVRLVNGEIYAEGIPFAGSSIYCNNKSIPISAIVYLGQAHETSICRLNGYQAFSKIWEGVSVNSWDKTDVELVSEVVSQIVKQVPIYYLKCTPDESAVIAVENVLKEVGKV